MNKILIIFVFTFFPFQAFSLSINQELHKEELVEHYSELLLDSDTHLVSFTSEVELKLFLDTIMRLNDQGALNKKFLLGERLKNFLTWEISKSLKYRILYILNEFNLMDEQALYQLQLIEESILRGEANEELLTHYHSLELKGFYELSLKDIENMYPEKSRSVASVSMGFYPQDRQRLQDLVDYENTPAHFRNGRYENTPRVFVFCRHNRRYHCLMMMKDKNGDFVREESGRLWSLPVLALARRSRSYDEIGGHTPSGVYTIDSVMPYADQTRVFGQYRRLILNFIPKSQDEELLKSFLPKSSHPYSWWRESVIGRDIGRDLLRIHGAGFKNYNPFSRHYPFVKTIGCIGTREGRYWGTDYKDQRVLLDTMMKASGLDPRYENETKLFGLLYLVEINNISDHVSLDEMIWYLQRS